MNQPSPITGAESADTSAAAAAFHPPVYFGSDSETTIQSVKQASARDLTRWSESPTATRNRCVPLPLRTAGDLQVIGESVVQQDVFKTTVSRSLSLRKSRPHGGGEGGPVNHVHPMKAFSDCPSLAVCASDAAGAAGARVMWWRGFVLRPEQLVPA